MWIRQLTHLNKGAGSTKGGFSISLVVAWRENIMPTPQGTLCLRIKAEDTVTGAPIAYSQNILKAEVIIIQFVYEEKKHRLSISLFQQELTERQKQIHYHQHVNLQFISCSTALLKYQPLRQVDKEQRRGKREQERDNEQDISLSQSGYSSLTYIQPEE